MFLLNSCSSKVKGRLETKIAKKNFLSASDLNYLNKNYDWEVQYSNRAKAYAQNLSSNQAKEQAIDNISNAEIKSLLNEAFLSSVEGKELSKEEIASRAALTEKLYKFLIKNEISTEKELADITSVFIIEQGLDDKSENQKVVVRQIRKIAEFLKYSNNYRPDKEMLAMSDKKSKEKQNETRGPASESYGDYQDVILDDRINEEIIRFEDLNEIDYVKILIAPSEYENQIRRVLVQSEDVTKQLTVKDIEVLSNYYLKYVNEVSYINRARLSEIKNKVLQVLRISNIISRDKIPDVKKLLENIHEGNRKLLAARIEKKIISYKLKSKKYAKLNSEEIKYHLQGAFEIKEFQDVEVAKKVAKKVHKILTKFTLFNDGLTKKQFKHVFQKIKEKFNGDSSIEAVTYFQSYLDHYIKRSKKFSNFRKIATRFDDSDSAFVIDELPIELKGLVDQENVYLLSLSLNEKKGLEDEVNQNSYKDQLIELVENSRRQPASVKKDTIFKIHGIGPEGLLISGQKLAFILASRVATPETLRALKTLGVDINATDERGYNALMVAIENKRLENILVLRDLGADIQAKTKDGKNIIDVAVQTNDSKVIDLVRDELL